MKASDLWIDIWNTLCDRRDGPSEEERNAHANRIQAKVDDFVLFLTNWITPKNFTYYLHCLKFHLADQIRMLPCDVMDASGQSQELVNQVMIKVQRYVIFLVTEME